MSDSKSSAKSSPAPSAPAVSISNNLSKKPENKVFERHMKAMKEHESDADKVDFLTKTLQQVIQENRECKTRINNLEKDTITLRREHDRLSAEHTRVQLQRSNLEQLSRELQKQKQATLDQCNKRIRGEETKRQEITESVQDTLNKVQAQIKESETEKFALVQKNTALQERMNEIADTFSRQDKNTEAIMEAQRAQLAIYEEKCRATEQHFEQLGKEKQEQILQMDKWRAQHTAVEQKLNAELSEYKKQYSELKRIVEQANQTCRDYKEQLEKAGKGMKQSYTELKNWKSKAEKSDQSCAKMALRCNDLEKSNENTKKRLQCMETLSRKLADERAEWRNYDEVMRLCVEESNDATTTNETIERTQRCSEMIRELVKEAGETLRNKISGVMESEKAEQQQQQLEKQQLENQQIKAKRDGEGDVVSDSNSCNDGNAEKQGEQRDETNEKVLEKTSKSQKQKNRRNAKQKREEESQFGEGGRERSEQSVSDQSHEDEAQEEDKAEDGEEMAGESKAISECSNTQENS